MDAHTTFTVADFAALHAPGVALVLVASIAGALILSNWKG